MKNMKNIKLYEDFDNFDGTEDEYLESPEYFVETYFNGQYSQLEGMLSEFRMRDKMRSVLLYMEETMSGENLRDLKNWIIEN